MYEKEINLIDVSFIFLRQSLPGNVFYASQNAQNRLQCGMGGAAGQSHVPGYMAQDFLTIGPLANGSKIPK